LFDAVAALVTGRAVIDYEAQAAIELEGLADEGEWGSYTTDVMASEDGWLIDPGVMLKELLDERRAGVSAALMSARFHAWVARSFAQVALHARESTLLNRVCLSGGTMHNRLLTLLLKRELNSMGFEVLLHRDISPGDGGLSYGQAAVAAALMQAESNRPLKGQKQNLRQFLKSLISNRSADDETRYTNNLARTKDRAGQAVLLN
jgi:hydrogenase maturation protein HypF